MLCVDDNQDAADSLSELLRLVGAVVEVCYSGPTALTVAGWFHPEACLLDLSMPGMGGCELAERLLDEAGGHKIFLIAITALSDPETRRLTKSSGFDLHLVKPVDPRDLMAVLADAKWWLSPSHEPSENDSHRDCSPNP